MIHFHGAGILLDIEGTTSSIRFVHDVLFPYARRRSADFLRLNWDDPSVRRICARLLQDAAKGDDWSEAPTPAAAQISVLEVVYRHMDADSKTTGLKELQGLIWDAGYRASHLRSHVFPDVAPALRQWREHGLDVRIYSSGSVTAQLAFFRQTDAGDLLPLFRGHYDTNIGSKREPASYRRIVADMKLAGKRILFVSDVAAELDAARTAGLQTALAERPGNAPVDALCGHARITSFQEIAWGER